MKWIKIVMNLPLVCVEDAIVVDSSNMTFDETVVYIASLVQEPESKMNKFSTWLWRTAFWLRYKVGYMVKV